VLYTSSKETAIKVAARNGGLLKKCGKILGNLHTHPEVEKYFLKKSLRRHQNLWLN
jgi:hypothetical protein